MAELSIVVGSNGAPGAVARCLAALEGQRDEVEVIVVEPDASPPEVISRFAWARFIERNGGTVPVLWRDGIRASTGRLVALTISPMEPDPTWVAQLRDALGTRDGVAGAIEPCAGLALADFAEYLSRYARDMRPFAPRLTPDLPGDNCAYRRAALDAVVDTYAAGFWEPPVNQQLLATGHVLEHLPDLVVHQGPSAGWRAFVRQRLVHGRAHGRQRGSTFATRRNLAGILGAPVVPPLLIARVLREVFVRRRFRLRALQALPLLVLFDVAWAAGEARGHLDALRVR